MLTNEFLSIAQMTIPETFEECLTYEMQILYLKRYIDEVAEGGIPSADLSDIWDAIHALEDEVEKVDPDKIEQEISDLKDKIESLENTTVTVGETVTGDPGSNANVENTGTDTNVVLKFTIPRGEKGEKGEQGERGETGAKGDPGEPGERGPAGERGPEGPQGNIGPEGPEGPRGEQGAQGLPGEKGEKGDPGEQGPTGERGPEGPQGERGPAGEAATVTVGETVTGEPGTPAKVENTGTAQNAVLKFTIPKGEKGEPGSGGGGTSTVSVDVGETVTGDPGSNANVENTGDDQNVVLKFTIPRGEKGDPGERGPQGPAGERGPEGPEGPQGATGERGPAGENGAPGAKGDPGESATVTVGETVTGDPGTDAKVENTGTEQNAVLKFTIPKGEKGDPGTGGGGSGVVFEIVGGQSITPIKNIVRLYQTDTENYDESFLQTVEGQTEGGYKYVVPTAEKSVDFPLTIYSSFTVSDPQGTGNFPNITIPGSASWISDTSIFFVSTGCIASGMVNNVPERPAFLTLGFVNAILTVTKE